MEVYDITLESILAVIAVITAIYTFVKLTSNTKVVKSMKQTELNSQKLVEHDLEIKDLKDLVTLNLEANLALLNHAINNDNTKQCVEVKDKIIQTLVKNV